jgi:hypothetical protein
VGAPDEEEDVLAPAGEGLVVDVAHRETKQGDFDEEHSEHQEQQDEDEPDWRQQHATHHELHASTLVN